MSFKYLASLRKIGRKIVLPSDKIAEILESHIDFHNLKNIIDFGAGTLYWSEYFAKKLQSIYSNDICAFANVGGGQMNKINQRNEKPYKIFAIDSIYSDILPKSNDSHICFGVDIFKVLSLEIDLVFMSDVLHHLDNANNALKRICENPIKYIVIKDIDANYSFGDFMNKTHDLLINRQKVCSIFPQNLLSILGQNGFECQYFYLPKLFYPHFLIIAKTTK